MSTFSSLRICPEGSLNALIRLGDLRSALGRIAEELRHQYLLGYYPTNKQKDDKSRKITVRVTRQGVAVRARPAYRPAQ